MFVFFQKFELAFEIMKLTFTMDQIVQQAPNGLFHNMSPTDVLRHCDLSRKKDEMMDQLKMLMINDHDI